MCFLIGSRVSEGLADFKGAKEYMKQKLIFSAVLAGILAVIFSCLSSGNAVDGSSENAAGQKNSGNASQGRTQRANAPLYTGDGGKGIVIAVPTPVMRNSTAADKWMPQLFQDLITGDLARYSAMTVLDRTNERLLLVEQELSLSGLYSDEDYIRIGGLTNADFIVAGRIANISGRYSVSFRINNTETNEIRASFNKFYAVDDIENGTAAKETVLELLAGMGIELTESGERSLLAIQPVDVRATTQLARGMVAAKSDNIVESLAFLSEALNSNITRNEASRNIHSFFTDISTASIRERANYAFAQIEKWNKIFVDLEKYIYGNLAICVYDFSVAKDEINIRTNSVNLTVSHGVKVVPNRTALLVYKTIVDNWVMISNDEKNKDWINNVRLPYLNDSNQRNSFFINITFFNYDINLYDDYGDRIARGRVGLNTSYTYAYLRFYGTNRDFQVLAQHKYYDDIDFQPIRFDNVPLDKVTDRMTPKIEQAYFDITRQGIRRFSIPIMTVAEWQEWLALQGNAS